MLKARLTQNQIQSVALLTQTGQEDVSAGWAGPLGWAIERMRWRRRVSILRVGGFEIADRREY